MRYQRQWLSYVKFRQIPKRLQDSMERNKAMREANFDIYIQDFLITKHAPKLTND